jgi:hypothetical protein
LIYYSLNNGTTWTSTELIKIVGMIWVMMVYQAVYTSLVFMSLLIMEWVGRIQECWINVNYLSVSQNGQYTYVNDKNAGLYLA